jgi:shikimate kinase
MGSGKSSVGRALARRLGVAFVDADSAIEQAAGRRIAEIFATDGEPAFRALEHEVVVRLLTDRAAEVLALGGGAAMHPGTQQALTRHACVVYLQVSLARALDRVGGDPARPVLARPDLPALYAERAPVYTRIADVVIDVDALDVEAVAARLQNLVGARHGPQAG